MSIEALAQEIHEIARIDGDHTTQIPGLSVHRRSVCSEPMPCIYGLGLAVVAQGAKQVTLREQVIGYGAGHSLLTTVDLPVVSHITQADLARPFLALYLTLDARALAQLAHEMALPALPREPVAHPISRHPLEAPLLDALLRLVRLQAEPRLAAQLVPLIRQEVMVRLLAGAHGPSLRHLVAVGSARHHITQAMAWLKQHYNRDVRMDELAARAHMSPSTFRQHFRQLTGMSPLQYQKQLRLQEARHLMLHQALDASSTAARVGYESASQFSREYSRLFGAPPQRDVRQTREEAMAEGAQAIAP
jgi:AraC-like DNA-binding protein